MDVKYVNPFAESFRSVMPQLGFCDIKTGEPSEKTKEVVTTGVVIVMGFIGKIKGNVVYTLSIEDAKNIASVMMMGMPVEEFDDMAQSALSELANMLTATAATVFASNGIEIDISTPTLLHGENVCVKMHSDPIQCMRLQADSVTVEINVSFDS